ncbi:hypothetical protein ACFQPG_06385 [Sphingomonas sp. GCM10030256]|uniref:hypothetical protein n=1 Tax=Sphingomonas sp. GCM10030256 TaxID=3273427 RepID=UPI00360FA9A3
MMLLAYLAVALWAPQAEGPLSNDPVALGKMHEVARCVVKDERKIVAKLLRIDWRTVSYADRLRENARRKGECLGNGVLRFNRLVFAGALAEHMVESGRIDITRTAAAEGQPIVARSPTEVMALCAVKAQPAQVSAMLGTGPGSTEERAAMRALAPTLGDCLAEGAQATLNAAGTRSVLALAAWHIADARGAGAAK